MKELKKIWIFIKGFIILNVIWFICSLLMNSRILPNPLKIYTNLPSLLENNFYIHIFASLYRVGIGLLIAFIIGVTIGLIMGYSDKMNKLLNPLIYFTYPIPNLFLIISASFFPRVLRIVSTIELLSSLIILFAFGLQI